ncbi:MAG: 16S rRNA (cytosine1402-N4)-methyltransferase [Granulosicoccus sp.]|jgi:16S rRNA (cytosine1402-N4)-methyltransferase
MTTSYHNPVLLQESIDGLNLQSNGIYADLTFGGGGHTQTILDQLEGGRLICFDQDPDAVANLPKDERVSFVQHNFRHIRNFLRHHDAIPVDGVLADLGISSHQIDEAERGFSTRFDAELDMRMSQDGELDAIALLNNYDEQQLTKVFRLYADLKNGRQVAQYIISYREGNELRSTSDLKSAIRKLLPRGKENSFLAKIFQAIRIEVNDEMGALQEMLEQLEHVVKPGGRISIISYHSLEDRMVKNLIRDGAVNSDDNNADLFGNRKLPFKAINRKPIIATDEENEANPRARSAKLRIAERT